MIPLFVKLLLLSLSILQMFGCNNLCIFLLFFEFNVFGKLRFIFSYLHLSLQFKLRQGLLVFEFLDNSRSIGYLWTSICCYWYLILFKLEFFHSFILTDLLLEVFIQFCPLVLNLFILKLLDVTHDINLLSEVLFLVLTKVFDFLNMLLMTFHSFAHCKLVMVLPGCLKLTVIIIHINIDISHWKLTSPWWQHFRTILKEKSNLLLFTSVLHQFRDLRG